jgi:hypothetical protein
VYFFVVPDNAGVYKIILGIPFFRDTSLTFDFEKGYLVIVNVIIGRKIVRAYIVLENTIRWLTL